MRKKVAIVTPFFHGIGGGETFVSSLIDQIIIKDKNSAQIITVNDPPTKWEGTPILKALVLSFKLLKGMFEGRARHNDIYHAQGIIAALVCYVYGFIFQRPIFVTILALYDFKDKPWWFRFACSYILNKADKIFVEGETGRKDLLDCGVKNKKIIEFYHWVDLNKYKPIKKTGHMVTVLFVGRPIEIKGIRVAKKLERDLFDIENLQFKFIENMSHYLLTKEYQKADILIVPSQYSEGFPRVIFEAAACGCIIMASSRGALPELVKPFGHIDNFYAGVLGYSSCGVLGYSSCLVALRNKQKSTRLYAEKFFSPKNAEVFINEYRS